MQLLHQLTHTHCRISIYIYIYIIMIYVIHQNGIVREHNTHTKGRYHESIRFSYYFPRFYAHCELKKQY